MHVHFGTRTCAGTHTSLPIISRDARYMVNLSSARLPLLGGSLSSHSQIATYSTHTKDIPGFNIHSCYTLIMTLIVACVCVCVCVCVLVAVREQGRCPTHTTTSSPTSTFPHAPLEEEVAGLSGSTVALMHTCWSEFVTKSSIGSTIVILSDPASNNARILFRCRAAASIASRAPWDMSMGAFICLINVTMPEFQQPTPLDAQRSIA